jgi:DNA-directed RNA polymerase specialized sigma24 family protein
MGPSFERLCHEHYDRLARVVFLIVGSRQEALDITQETFARAYEHWTQVQRMENPEGWLYRVGTNLAISWRRRSLRRLRPVGASNAVPAPEVPDPTLALALFRLTPGQRAVVVLRFYLDLSVDATARSLGKRPGTVRALTSQAMTRLRADLGETFLEERDEDPAPRTAD